MKCFDKLSLLVRVPWRCPAGYNTFSTEIVSICPLTIGVLAKLTLVEGSHRMGLIQTFWWGMSNGTYWMDNNSI